MVAPRSARSDCCCGTRTAARLTLWSVAGISGVSIVFGALAYALLRAGRRVGMQAGNGLRLALASLARRRGESVAQILIFGLAIMLLLIMVLLRTALLDEWRTQLPEGAPNHFLMNVAPEQVEPLDAKVRGHVEQMGELYPMTRGRVVAVNGIETKRWEADPPRARYRRSESRFGTQSQLDGDAARQQPD